MVLNIHKIRESGMSLFLAWDVFMILFLLLNFGLIIFDMTYLFLRPYYFHYAPFMTRIYDPVKGVLPHPLTSEYLQLADKVAREYQASGYLDGEALAELRDMSADFITRNPFMQSGQGKNLEKIAKMMRKTADEAFSANAAEALADFWRLTPANAKARLESYQQDIRPLLAVNFRRARGLDGEYVDHFIWLDLPFILIFLAEFLAQWHLAFKRRTYPRWFVYPLYHWYDLLGLFPHGYLRALRFFRVVSIYVRLNRHELSTVGNDVISRAVKKYSNILTEEIADLVAIRILAEVQDEINTGASIDIVTQAIVPRREELKSAAVDYAAGLIRDRSATIALRDILQRSLVQASHNLPTLALVPGAVRAHLMTEIGLAIYDAMLDALLIAIRKPGDHNLISDLVDKFIADLAGGSQDGNLNRLSREVALDILENMKKAVAVKKWALPDRSP